MDTKSQLLASGVAFHSSMPLVCWLSQFVNKNSLSTFNKVPVSLVLLLNSVFIPGLIAPFMCTHKSVTLHFCCVPPRRFKTVHCLLYADTDWCPKIKPRRKDWELWSKPAEPTVGIQFHLSGKHFTLVTWMMPFIQRALTARLCSARGCLMLGRTFLKFRAIWKSKWM